MTKIDIVCTTIGDGSFLKPYTREILDAKAEDRVRIIVISDQKTDHKALNQAVVAAWDEGINVLCPTLRDQVTFMQSAGAPDLFGWNTDGRRNIGYLMSWRDNADIMISVDDDNLPQAGWLQAHEHALTAGSMPFTDVESGFFNPCDLLPFSPGGVHVYARGFPYSKRAHSTRKSELRPCDVVINAGLWYGDPDVDAITRLALRPVSEPIIPGPGPVCLGDKTWAPVNSQNTAIRHEALPAYCFFESTKRFGDIWQGYFAQACAKHLGQHVRFGTPVTDCAVRNDHDLLNDLRLEYDGIMMLDQVLDWLTELKLEGTTYTETYDCLRQELDDAVDRCEFTVRAEDILRDIISRMTGWTKVIERLS